MNRYEGLNLPDLMELLHGLALPRPVPWMPATPGWWIALAWLVAVTAIAALALVRRRRRNKYRRRAEAELKAIQSQADENSPAAAAKLAALLKRTALVAYPRRQVASLYGDDWARFLVESADGDARVAASATALSQAAYRPTADVVELFPAARRWIRLHRA